ncbi:MAG: hypothetical protein OXF46_06925 [Rhodobacteraceae bacterium]|nr:hypothetical protein [Paracoccaceae bacterium]
MEKRNLFERENQLEMLDEFDDLLDMRKQSGKPVVLSPDQGQEEHHRLENGDIVLAIENG